jgi:hypothetical protein
MTRPLAGRLAASAGTLLVLAALVLLWTLRLSVPYDLYVSALGATGMPTARGFEVFLLLIVVGGALVAWAGRGVRSRVRWLAVWAPAVSIWISCAFFLVDSQVTCTAGCPVPVPGSAAFTWQDLGHTTAAILAFAFAAVAIVQCAFSDGPRLLRRLSLACGIAVAVVSAAGGLMSLLDFYPTIGSRFEIVATTVGLGWLVVFGVTLASAASVPSHGVEQLVGEHDQPVDLVLIPIHPPHLGLGPDRHEAVVLLPDDERALGAEDVLLPPHLPQVVPGDPAPR